jgi:hypothetical protein
MREEVKSELAVLQQQVGYDADAYENRPAPVGHWTPPGPPVEQDLVNYKNVLEELVGELYSEAIEGAGVPFTGLQRDQLEGELLEVSDHPAIPQGCAVCGRRPTRSHHRRGAFCGPLTRCEAKVAVVCHPEDAEYLEGWRRQLPPDVLVLPARSAIGQRRAIVAARLTHPDALWHLSFPGGGWRRLRVEP